MGGGTSVQCGCRVFHQLQELMAFTSTPSTHHIALAHLLFLEGLGFREKLLARH